MQETEIIVAHPGKQHSFQTAIILNNNHLLKRYCTSVYHKKGTIEYTLNNLLSKKDKNKAISRRMRDFPDEKIAVLAELSGLISLLVNRIHVSSDFKRKVRRFASGRFNKKLCKICKKDSVSSVIMYDTNAFECFSYLKTKKPSVIRILDMSAVARPYAAQILLEESARVNDPVFTDGCKYLTDKKYIMKSTEEIEMADYLLVASSFTKQSLISCGVSEEKIKLIPYGIDINSTNPHDYHSKEKLKIIYVGYVDYTKGIHYLLDAIMEMQDVELDIYGVVNQKSKIFNTGKNMNNVHFHGFVSKEELNRAYGEADVFVFPSLIDGFGMVILEAMSQGLPVIVTENCAGHDVVEDQKDGFVIQAFSSDIIQEKIRYFLNNRNAVQEMGCHAYRSSLKFSKDSYEKKLIKTISEIIGK